MMHDYPPSDWPEMSVRVEEAQRRIRAGLGLLSIPAHWGDADLVLGDLARENAALRKRVAELELAVDEAMASLDAEVERRMYEPVCGCMVDHPEDVCEVHSPALAKLQADLDAALDWIEHDEEESIPPAGLWQRIKALLEKRRERG